MGKQTRERRLVSQLSDKREQRNPIGTEIYIPNHSGAVRAPSLSKDIANKQYVDDNIGGAVEGTAILSTGETGGTKFLREDGDGTCSWQAGGSGDALTTNPLSQFAATTSAQLAGVLSDETGTGAAVFATSPTLVTPALGTPASGTLTNCTGLPVAGTLLAAGTNCTLSTNTLNVDDAFIKNDADDTSTGKITAANFAVTGDNSSADTTYVPMVLYNTDATPPTASTVPIGTIYIQYTA